MGTIPLLYFSSAFFWKNRDYYFCEWFQDDLLAQAHICVSYSIEEKEKPCLWKTGRCDGESYEV